MVGVRLATVLFDKIPPIKRAFHIVIYTTKSIMRAIIGKLMQSQGIIIIIGRIS